MAKKETKAVAESSVETEPKFSKTQILASAKYVNRRDLVSSLLKDNEMYTKAEVDEIISKFMKGTVK